MKWLLLKHQQEKDDVKNMRPVLYVPVLAGASGVGGLVWVARVLRLVVHVSGRRWAGFTSPASSSSPRAALLADSSQLALALGDGLGGESQGQLQQVNLTPEGIYLGGRWGGKQEKGGGRAGEATEKEGRGVGEDGGQESHSWGELRWLWSERDGQRESDQYLLWITNSCPHFYLLCITEGLWTSSSVISCTCWVNRHHWKCRAILGGLPASSF